MPGVRRAASASACPLPSSAGASHRRGAKPAKSATREITVAWFIGFNSAFWDSAQSGFQARPAAHRAVERLGHDKIPWTKRGVQASRTCRSEASIWPPQIGVAVVSRALAASLASAGRFADRRDERLSWARLPQGSPRSCEAVVMVDHRVAVTTSAMPGASCQQQSGVRRRPCRHPVSSRGHPLLQTGDEGPANAFSPAADIRRAHRVHRR